VSVQDTCQAMKFLIFLKKLIFFLNYFFKKKYFFLKKIIFFLKNLKTVTCQFIIVPRGNLQS